MPDGLRVSGHGEATGQPDIARATLGVEARANSAAEATDQVSRTMQRVIAAVKAQGIADADLQTEQVSVYFEQEYPPQPPPRPLPSESEPSEPRQEGGSKGQEGAEPRAGAAAPVGPRGFYRASNTVRVTVRDLATTSAVLGAATQAGANAVHGLSFEIDDPKPLQAQARAEAVEDARNQASQLASLAGAKLGRVVSISAQPQGPVGFVRSAASPMAMKEGGMPIERGELTIQQQVEIVYAIEPADD